MTSKDSTEETKGKEGKKSDGLTVWGVIAVVLFLILFCLVGGAILGGIAYGTAALLSWGVPHIETLADGLMRWTEENPEQAEGIQFFLCTFVASFVVFLHNDKW